MKHVVLTIVFALLSVPFFAQSWSSGATDMKSELMTYSTTIDALLTKVSEIKNQADVTFSKEAQSISSKKAELAQRRSAIEADNDKEKDMMSPQWPARIAAREALVREEAKVGYDEQVLSGKKADFSHRIKQVEQHIQSNYINTNIINATKNSSMKSYLGTLDNFMI